MPLDARKIQHILQVVARSFNARQRTLVLVYRTSDGYTYTTLQAIFRLQRTNDPLVLPASATSADAWLIAPIETSLTGVVYIADTSTATASAILAAPKYEILAVLPTGLPPGGSHLRVALRRLR